MSSIAPIRRDFARSLSLPSIVARCLYVKDVDLIFTGDGRFVDKRILVENEPNRPTATGNYAGYVPLDLTMRPDGLLPS